MKNSQIAAVIFTFQNDALCAIEATRAFFRTYPGASLLIAEDATKPLQEKHRLILKQMGCETTLTYWPRWGNLCGRDTVKGQLQTMHDFGVQKQSEWVFKIDSDTCILSPKAFGYGFIIPTARAIFISTKYAGSHLPQFPNGYGWGIGAAYALRLDTIQDLITFFNLKQAAVLGEDREISTAARILYGERDCPYIRDLEDIYAVVYYSTKDTGKNIPIVEHPIEHVKSYLGASVVTFGNRRTCPDGLNDAEQRIHAAKWMKYANDSLEEKLH